MVWVVLSLMTLAAVFCVVWPLSKARTTVLEAGDDLGFYRDQLRALEADVAAGAVSVTEAEGSRAEIARRLLAAADRPAPVLPAAGRRRRLFAAAIVVAMVIPVASLGLYLQVGAPTLRDAPLAERLADPSPDDMPAAIARIERHLAGHPDDGRGFALLAPIYMRLNRFDDAANAYRRALALLGETAERRVDYAGALTQAAGGTITPEAEAAYEQALVDNPGMPQASFFLGIAAAQRGDKDRARTLWSALAAQSPPDAPWLPLVRDRLASLDGATAPAGATAAAPSGPAAAIAALPAADRLQAIHGMVEGLASRLQADGGDAEGWLKLVRAYTVLGETDKARGALAQARRNLAADAPALVRLEGLARELGLGGQG